MVDQRWGKASLLCAFVTLVSLSARASVPRQLTVAERVAAEMAIERVSYSHQIGRVLPFQEAVPRVVLERRVRTYLKQSAALQRFWSTSITPEALAREAERMARGSRMPERLRELHAALGDDPLLIQECLVRPALAGRLVRSFFQSDQRLHAAAKREAEELKAALENAWLDPYADDPRRMVRDLFRADRGVGTAAEDEAGLSARIGDGSRVELSPEEFEARRRVLPPRVGGVTPVRDENGRFVFDVLLDDSPGHLRVATFGVQKKDYDHWWNEVEGSLHEEDVPTLAAAPGPVPPLSATRPEREWHPEALMAEPNLFHDPLSAPCQGDDVWDNGSLGSVLDLRLGGRAVWTGSAMIVWGGNFSTGSRYDPATDAWSPLSNEQAPLNTGGFSLVWTGSRMIVWGGYASRRRLQ